MADRDQLKPLQARGKALRHTDEELDEMTSPEAMEQLVEGAREDWQENASRSYRTLLEAKEDVSDT